VVAKLPGQRGAVIIEHGRFTTLRRKAASF
jgi:hypothetical protein